MPNNFSITGGIEILQVVDAVSKEKSLEKSIILEALREAVEAVANRKYGFGHGVQAEIDERNGDIRIFKRLEIVEEVEDFNQQISFKDAKKANKDAVLGEFISEPLPPIDFGRVNSATFKSVLTDKIYQAERDKEFEEFKDREGEIINGVVKMIENGNVFVNFGRVETVMRREESIPRESFRNGDRIRAYILKVSRERKGAQIFLSRSHPNFLEELFKQEVPEVYDGVVEIKGVVRDPGSRAKMAVFSSDASTDPVGACIGPRGSRVSAIYNELQGEKIDIIEWSEDVATYAVNAIASKSKDSYVEVSRIVIDEDKNLIEAIIPEDHKSLAIGRRGQNVKLASDLIGWDIDVVSEDEYSKKQSEEFARVSDLFMEALNVEEVIAQLLASEGFKTVEEVAYVSKEEMLSIEGFEEELVTELQKRAEDYLAENKPAENKNNEEVAEVEQEKAEDLAEEKVG